MANWFKIYETDLDEKRLKYALNKLPEVGWVWIGILSECCKHRSDTIRYSQSEVDLFGFSDALKVSIPKINAAINLLAEIQYITKTDTQITVTRWREKQSEYNHRKQRGDYRIISDNIGEYPLEERRGEENIHTHTAEAFPEVSVPSLDEVLTEAEMHGVKKESAESFFNHHQGNALWINQHHRLIDWRHKLKAWGERDRQTGGKSNANNGKNGQQRINRNIGTANEGDASEYANLRRVNGRVVKA